MDLSNSQTIDGDLEEKCFIIANKLISAYHINIPRVVSLYDIHSRLFIKLFTAIFKIPLQDIIYDIKTVEDEAHNIQTVIDTLSLDLLGISLSHIIGEDIIVGNILSIYNLLQIFEGCMLYLPLSRNNKSSLINKESYLISDTYLPSQDDVKLTLVCTVCGYRKEYDEFVCFQAKNFTFSCPLCQCPILIEENSRFTSIRSLNNYKYQNPSNESVLMPSSRIPNSMTYRSCDGLINTSSETNSSSSLGSIPHPTLIENEKLKPEFANIGIRDFNPNEETVPKTIQPPPPNVDLFTISSKFEMSQGKFNRFSAIGNQTQKSYSSTQESVTSTTTSSIPLNTVIFKSQMKKMRSSNDLHKILRNEDPAQNIKITLPKRLSPKRRLSKSLDDITCFKQDQMVQTSDSLFLGNSPVSKLDKQTYFEKKTSDFFKDRQKQNKNETYQYKRSIDQIRNLPQKPTISDPKLFAQSSVLPRRSVSCSPPHVTKYNSLVSGRRCSQSISPPRKETRNQCKIQLDSKLSKKTVLSNKTQCSFSSEASIQGILDGLMEMRRDLKCDALLKKSQTLVQAKEAVKRQQILSNILQKEINRNHNLVDFKKSTQQVKTKNENFDSTVLQLHWDELYSNLKKKIQKRNSENQQEDENSVDEEMNSLKDQVYRFLQQIKEEIKSPDQRHFLERLENFYQSQFLLLAKSLAVEKRDVDERTKAQKRVLKMMKNQFKRKREKEVQNMEERLN